MAKKITSPDTDDSHDATRGADQLFRPIGHRPFQKQNTGARSETGEQIIKRESHGADDPFQPGSDDEERVKIESNMQRPEMQKKRRQHPPVLAAIADRPRLERAQAIQSKRVRRTAESHFDDKHREVQRDETEHRDSRTPGFETERGRRRAIALLDAIK